MKTCRKIGLLFVGFFLCSLCAVAQTPTWAGKCVGVSDGDTIGVMRDGVEVKIRLHGVDCPEKAQAFGQKAKEFTSSKVFGQQVAVYQTDTDRYGRTVAHIVLADGMNLSGLLVEAGFAWYYQQYAPELEATMRPLEAQARANRLGLWADANPIPPWDYRKGGKAAQQPAQEQQMPSAAPAQGQPAAQGEVWLGASGTKYHDADCMSLKKSTGKHAASMSDAIAQGYKPCGICQK